VTLPSGRKKSKQKEIGAFKTRFFMTLRTPGGTRYSTQCAKKAKCQKRSKRRVERRTGGKSEGSGRKAKGGDAFFGGEKRRTRWSATVGRGKRKSWFKSSGKWEKGVKRKTSFPKCHQGGIPAKCGGLTPGKTQALSHHSPLKRKKTMGQYSLAAVGEGGDKKRGGGHEERKSSRP